MGRGPDEIKKKKMGDQNLDPEGWEMPHGEDDGVSIQVGFDEEKDSEPPPGRVSIQVVAEDGLNAAIASIVPQVAFDLEAGDASSKEEANKTSGAPVGQRPEGFDTSAEETDEFSDLCDEAEALCEENCFDQAFQILEMLGQRVSDHPYLRDLQSACELRALEYYEKELSPLDRVFKLAIEPKELTSHKLNQESAFVLSRIDGTSTIDDLLDISGFPKLKTLRILFRMWDSGIVEFDQ